MSVEHKLLETAIHLVKAANKELDAALPQKLASIVKTHAALAIGAAWIPVPGADWAAGIAAIWGMYFRINKELGIPFEENIIKSVASGVGTNLAGYLTALAFGGALKFVPGLGTLAAAVLMSTASYALVLASGWVYMNALTMLLGQSSSARFTKADWDNAVNRAVRDKAAIKSFIDEAKRSRKK